MSVSCCTDVLNLCWCFFKGEGSAETDVTDEGQKASVEGKKDPILRRRELLLDSGLAEVCHSHTFCCCYWLVLAVLVNWILDGVVFVFLNMTFLLIKALSLVFLFSKPWCIILLQSVTIRVWLKHVSRMLVLSFDPTLAEK